MPGSQSNRPIRRPRRLEVHKDGLDVLGAGDSYGEEDVRQRADAHAAIIQTTKTQGMADFRRDEHSQYDHHGHPYTSDRCRDNLNTHLLQEEITRGSL